MRFLATSLAAAAALVLCLTAPAAAQYEGDRGFGANPQTFDRSTAIEPGSFGSLRGHIASAWTEPRGSDTHQLVVLHNGLDQRFIVDLGPTRQLAGLEFNKGDRIEVQGYTAIRGDDAVLLANRVALGGRDDRAYALNGAERDTWRRLTGAIVDQKTEDLPGSDEKHKLVLLKLGDDRRLAVDLGPADGFGDIDLDEGETVTVEGNLRRMDGRTVLMADRLETEEGATRITRSDIPRRADDVEFERPDARDFEASREGR